MQDHFEYVIKKHETFSDNRSTQMHVTRIENRFRFEIKSEYYLKLLISETMKLLGST